jgi:hypothetical protein
MLLERVVLYYHMVFDQFGLICRLRALNNQLMLRERVFLYYHVVFDHFGLLQVASPERSADGCWSECFYIITWSMIIFDYCRLRALNDQLILLERVFLYYHVVYDHFGLLQVASPE